MMLAFLIIINIVLVCLLWYITKLQRELEHRKKNDSNKRKIGFIKNYILPQDYSVNTREIVSKIELIKEYESGMCEVRHVEIMKTFDTDFYKPLTNLNKNVKLVKYKDVVWEDSPGDGNNIVNGELFIKLINGEVINLDGLNIKLDDNLNKSKILNLIINEE